MFATAIAARLDRAGVHYGWVIVVVTFVTLLTTAGAMGLPGALILSLNKEFGWDTGEISSALALRLALFGLRDLSGRGSSPDRRVQHLRRQRRGDPYLHQLDA